MAVAIELAVTSVDGGGGPFGAVVVRDNTILGRGQNQVIPCHDPSAHAEIQAIRDACQRLGHHVLSGCEIYSSCEPCPMCLGAILWARIDRVYFAASRREAQQAGFDDAAFYEEISRPLADRQLPMQALAQDDRLRPFQVFRNHPDSQLY
jgi:tRNA(Arg) A34 adenosine deaminase TadA